MSASNAMETNVLLLYFNNTAHALVGDASGLQPSGTAGSLYVSLHTADPGEAGDQTTNETSYTDYARVAVARSGAGWTVSGDEATNAAVIQFPTCGATGATITHFGIGVAGSSTGQLLFSGALSASLAVSSGIQPEFAIGELSVTAD